MIYCFDPEQENLKKCTDVTGCTATFVNTVNNNITITAINSVDGIYGTSSIYFNLKIGYTPILIPPPNNILIANTLPNKVYTYQLTQLASGTGNMYGSFGNMRRKDFKGDTYYDEMNYPAKDSEIQGIGGDDFDTEEFETFKELHKKYGDNQRWFRGRNGETMFNKYKETTGKPFKVKTRRSEMEEDYGNGAILDHIFGESKIDKVLSKYFEITESEKKALNDKKVVNENIKKSNIQKKMVSVKKLSETIEQELSSQKFLETNSNFTFLGKTNKKNLVFEGKSGQFKITPEGFVI
jgi:hypothetical protein